MTKRIKDYNFEDVIRDMKNADDYIVITRKDEIFKASSSFKHKETIRVLSNTIVNFNNIKFK